MDAAKVAELAKWCEQQSRLLAADWEFQSRAGSANRLQQIGRGRQRRLQETKHSQGNGPPEPGREGPSGKPAAGEKIEKGEKPESPQGSNHEKH